MDFVGAANVKYKFQGSSNVSKTSGLVPLVTKKVVIPLFLYSVIKSESSGYNVGSPAKEIATLVGVSASLSLSAETLSGNPKYPVKSTFWAFRLSSAIKSGGSYSRS